MDSKKILIIGGGIGGLTMMQFLKNSRHKVTLIERENELKADGAGIMLGINAMKIIKTLGLLESILADGISLNQFCITDAEGGILGKSDMGFLKQQTGLPTVAIHRTHLHKILSNGLERENIELGTSVKHISTKATKNIVLFENGRSEFFDLIIAADGIRSYSRKLCGVPSMLRFSGYTCWRFVIDVPENFCTNIGFEMWGKGKRFGIVPIAGNKLYCFATCNATEKESKYQKLNVKEFKSLFSEFGGKVPKILTYLTENHKLIHGDLRDQKNICMTKGNIAFMGDAAHAATPNMGQGAGMAIEDAFILNRSLDTESNMMDALKIYNAKRTPRVKTIRDKSYSIGKVSQWESSLAISLRNRVLKTLPSMGLTKSQKKLLLNF